MNDSPSWRISPSIVLLPSSLGRILSGNRSDISVNVAAFNLLNLERAGPLPETEIKRFWDLETIGIKAHQDKWRNTKDAAVLHAFQDTFRMEYSQKASPYLERKTLIFQAT